MATRKLKRIAKHVLAFAIVLFLLQLSHLLHSSLLKPREMKNGQEIKSNRGNVVENSKKILDHDDNKHRRRTQNGEIMIPGINSSKTADNLYGSECPPNPHKRTLNYLFNYWMALDSHYNLSSFLCGGSLIGSLRDGDLIPYDRDIDVCVTFENYQKVRLLRSGKPIRYRKIYRSHQIHLVVQEDFANDDVSSRTRVDCRGRILKLGDLPKDPCSFDTPGARLISRGVYVDVFVFREHGVYLRDHEYEKEHLKADIFPLKHCTFMHVKTKCPRNEMSLLLKYYRPDVLINPHYRCENTSFVSNNEEARKEFKIWFHKRLRRPYLRKKST